jgi:uncharacterized membrane protein
MKRFWEIDILRGSAVVAMIVFHVFYLLVFFHFIAIDLFVGFWWWFPRCIAATFLLLVGLSLTLSHARAKSAMAGRKLFHKFMRRGVFVFLCGMGVTIVTLVAFAGGNSYVLFGILHLIGVSIVAGYFLLRFTMLNLVLGLSIIGIGFWLGSYRFPFYWLLWLGFRPDNYFPVDYLPILPWGGYIPLGIFLGKMLYPDGVRCFPFPEWGRVAIIRIFAFLGRHSLPIYLAHIPVIYGVLLLIRSFSP